MEDKFPSKKLYVLRHKDKPNIFGEVYWGYISERKFPEILSELRQVLECKDFDKYNVWEIKTKVSKMKAEILFIKALSPEELESYRF